jgi:signal transduction histidine kinase
MPGGRVSLETYCIGDEVRFGVQDNGIGIPSEELPRIFDRFFQVDDSRTGNQSGHGLGLSICKKLTELYEGKIQVNSKLGVGTEFMICFPRLRVRPEKSRWPHQ